MVSMRLRGVAIKFEPAGWTKREPRDRALASGKSSPGASVSVRARYAAIQRECGCEILSRWSFYFGGVARVVGGAGKLRL